MNRVCGGKASWLVLALGLVPWAPAQAQLTVRSGAAADVAGITPVRDLFRADLGGGTTAGANGLFDDGVRQRREINWDAVPAGFSSPNSLPGNFFNVNSPRGAVFSTPGSGFEVSANAGGGTPINFGNIDPSYVTTFAPFSPQKLFTTLGSNVMDVTFFVPGTGIVAGTRGFGVLFSDVDVAGTTALQFFDSADQSLGAFAAPPQPGSTGFSFLGAFMNSGEADIFRVRIFLGNSALGTGVIDNPGAGVDLVVMDDFIYGNPVAVPEPATLSALGAIGLGAILWQRRHQRQRKPSRRVSTTASCR